MKCPVYVFVLCENSLEVKIEKGGGGDTGRRRREEGNLASLEDLGDKME